MSSREQLQRAYGGWIKALTSKNIEAISSSIADTVIHNGQVFNKETYSRYLRETLECFSSHSMETDMITVDVSDRAIADRLIHRGILQMPCFSAPITGKTIEWSEHILLWFDSDDKINRVETLVEVDALRTGASQIPHMPTSPLAPAPPGFDLKAMYWDYNYTTQFARENLSKHCHDELTHQLQTCSLDEFRNFIEITTKQIEGFKVTVLDLITDEASQHIAARIELSGKPLQEFAGIAPTGKEVRFVEHSYYKLSGGKIIHYWGLSDWDAYKKCLEE
ncbi:hypothetical protein HJFPF1_10917 [Paramyrothecium foliicola]|nr:hypothetical protein HJFPF1_10917 [Paramyrothecium foliicola]